jgi:hypothetical protein
MVKVMVRQLDTRLGGSRLQSPDALPVIKPVFH